MPLDRLTGINLADKEMGGVTNTLGYITAAFAMGMLLKGTDWISWRIDERSVKPQHVGGSYYVKLAMQYRPWNAYVIIRDLF